MPSAAASFSRRERRHNYIHSARERAAAGKVRLPHHDNGAQRWVIVTHADHMGTFCHNGKSQTTLHRDEASRSVRC
jgi:hypothetical protein